METILAGLLGVALGAVVSFLVLRRPAPASAIPAAPAAVLPEAVLSEVLDVLLSGAVVLDAADEVLYVNPVAADMRVVRSGRLVSASLGRLVRDVRREGRGAASDATLADGREVLARAAAAGAGHVVLLLDDLTESRRLDAVRRDFVANVSHELKTPVGALLLLAEAVHDGEGDPETTRRFAARMIHEANRLSRLVQELIDLSRLQGADPKPSRANVAVSLVVTEAVDRTRLAADTKSIQVVSGGDLELRVTGDERQLVTALANLIDNAIAYSPEGTRVSVGVREREGDVELSVKDEGIGISGDDTDRIFERFYRADPARSRATGGTGLGLAIVKHIASNHGGRVSVWSTEGLGSTFTLHLPAAELVAGSSEPAVSGRKA